VRAKENAKCLEEKKKTALASRTKKRRKRVVQTSPESGKGEGGLKRTTDTSSNLKRA